MPHYDVIIVGGGIVGAVAALALTKNSSLKVAMLDAQSLQFNWHSNRAATRVSAISLASKRIFENLNVWQHITSKRISPYQKMHIWEEQGFSVLNFDSADINTRVLGYIIEDDVIRTSLFEEIQTQSQIDVFSEVKLLSLRETSQQIELMAADERLFSANLVIGADGANSWVRGQSGIQLKTRDYQHTAVVATVETALPHEACAWQRFLSTGPLAFLPLTDANASSIVWSTKPEHAEELLKLNDNEFKKILGQALGNKLGNVLEIGMRHHFPLYMRHAKQYVKSRLALIGDAAHTIHPLAGQGLNLGLLDAACIAEVILKAQAKQRDYSSHLTLRRYERWRKGNNLAMLAMVEALKHLFMSDNKAVIRARELGFALTNNMGLIKNFFINYAIGKRNDMPALAEIKI